MVLEWLIVHIAAEDEWGVGDGLCKHVNKAASAAQKFRSLLFYFIFLFIFFSHLCVGWKSVIDAVEFYKFNSYFTSFYLHCLPEPLCAN